METNMNKGKILILGLCNSREKHAECGLQGSLRTNKYVNHRLNVLTWFFWNILYKIVELILT